MTKPRKTYQSLSFKDGISAAYDRLKSLTMDDKTITVDNRLTYGQLHHLVVDTLGMEPLDFVAMLLSMSMVAQSRVVIAPTEAARLAFMLHDRLTPMPDRDARRLDAKQSQFELEFAWQDQPPIEGEVLEAAE